MRQATLLAALVLSLCLPAAPVEAGGPLPSGARALTSVKLSGFAAAYAVTYRTNKTYLGVVQRGDLLWHITLPSAQARVFAPRKTGFFGAIVKNASHSTFYAFHLHHGRVESGVVGSTTGSVSGDAGAHRSGGDVIVLNHDTAHVGSVKYRTLSHFALCGGGYCLQATTRQPDYAPASYPKPNGVAKTAHGDTILIRLEIAATEADREHGLMDRTSLDPDSGMIFVWEGTSLDPFWMKDTLIPLTVAFMDADGTILETQDMQPLSETLHYPRQPYHYALEVNQGFFAQNGIQVGDRIQLTLTP